MNFQKLVISLLFSFAHFLQGEKIYLLYGGVWQGNSSDSNSICVFSIHSNTSQSIHLTNYKNYDTLLKISAFQSIDFFIQRKFCMILVDENNKNDTGKYKPLLIAKTNNCTDTIQLPTIEVGKLAIATFNQSKLFNVFPNPAKQGEPITISVPADILLNTNSSIEIYSLTGQKIREIPIAQPHFTIKINTSGVYLLKYTNNYQSIIIVVQ